MADFVKITKNGLIPYNWNPDLQDYLPAEPEEVSFHLLRSKCVIEEKVTLGDILNIVDQDELLKSFISMYSWCGVIDELHEEAKLPVEPLVNDEPLIELLIESYGEIHGPFDFEKELTDMDQFEGVDLNFSANDAKGVSWSISCTPLTQISNLPVKLVELCKFSKDHEPLFTTRCHYSLLEVLDCIYWEISFHGGPKEKAEFINGLKVSMDEIKEQHKEDAEC